MKYCGFRKIILTFLSISIIGLSGCQQSPVRNPFAGRSEPKLGELPSISESRPIASKVAWSTSTLSKQVRFSKLQPYLTPEYVYAADRDGKIIALNRQTGKTRWKSKSNKKYSAGPYLIENYLLLFLIYILVLLLLLLVVVVVAGCYLLMCTYILFLGYNQPPPPF